MSEKSGNLHNVITYNVIWANQKTESFEYHWNLTCTCALSRHFVKNWTSFQVSVDTLIDLNSPFSIIGGPKVVQQFK